MVRFFRFVAVCVAVLAGGIADAGSLRLGAPFTEHMMVQADAPVVVWGWDVPGTSVQVRLAGHSAAAVSETDGAWRVELPAISEPGPHTLEVVGSETVIFTDVLAGDIWWCSGQSNMVWPVEKTLGKDDAMSRPSDPRLRVLQLPNVASEQPAADLEASWQIADGEARATFSSVAYHFGAMLRRETNRPIGLIQAAWSGSNIQTWIADPRIAASQHRDAIARIRERGVKKYEKERKDWDAGGQVGKEPTREFGAASPQQGPSLVYNGMVHPLQGLHLRGVLWYQGESNGAQPGLYVNLFKDLVEGWREDFRDPDLPVYFVQLPAFKSTYWPAFRDMQRRIDLPHTHMVVTIDVGEAENLHPTNKQPVGERLARMALVNTYGHELVPGGPRVQSVRRSADDVGSVVVTFDWVGEHLQSLSDDGELGGFELVDENGAVHPAVATITDGQSIRVSSGGLTHPVEIRYAGNPDSQISLFNSAGLPASPFIEAIP